MKTILINSVCILMVCGFSALHANPIYMKYDGIDGSVSAQVEVRNGKAVLKKLKPGTYTLSLIFTGKDAKMADGSVRTRAHVKVFDGRSGFAGGVRVATGDVNGDGRADVITGNTTATGTHAGGGGGGAGKVSMRDFSFSVMTVDGKTGQTTTQASNHVTLRDINVPLQPGANDVSGRFGSIKIAPPAGTQAGDSFFDVFTELSIQ